MPSRLLHFTIYASALTLTSLLGCGNQQLRSVPSAALAGISGNVHGGQQPIAGATIQLYAAGTSGDGSSAMPLLTASVQTDGAGSFNLNGLYTCPSASTNVYLTATGGNPGLRSGTLNANSAAMVALGPCGSLSTATYVEINEMTTVAAVYALARFMQSYSAVGSAALDSQLMSDAFVTAGELVNTGTATVPGLGVPAGQTVPVLKITALANIISTCINSAGGVAGDGSACGSLFSLATPATGAAPKDTIAALLNIANNPTNNVASLFFLTSPTAPFEPTMVSAPSDWTLSLTSPTPSPTFTPGSGTYSSLPLITLSDSNTTAQIYYTLDDSTPTTSSKLYTGAISLSATAMIRAIAVAAGISSVPVAGTYTLLTPTISLTPSTVSLTQSQTQTFNATVSGTSNTAVTWSVTPAIGTISATGVYTAPASITNTQAVTVTATTVATPSVSATSIVSLTPVSITLNPGTVTLTASQTQSFAAIVSNSSNPSVIWSISPALGTISAVGLYTAPTTVGSALTVNVIATSVSNPSMSATASISLSTAPTLSNVQTLGVVPTTQPLAGLGFNLNPENSWEFALAAAAGTKHARFQCGWNETETQTPPPQNTNLTTKFVLGTDCVSGLALSKQYGMQPTLIAAYGAPYHPIMQVALPNGAAIGAKSINIQFSSGVGGDTLASMKPFYDTILNVNQTQITAVNSYAGALITNVALTDPTHATLTLASALTAALPANTSNLYTINEYLHPPAATFSPNDSSVIAYANYAEFLAQSIASAGLTGSVEIWNEPPWGADPWDSQVDFYDVFPGAATPGPLAQGLPNWGFAAALQSQPNPVGGVTYVWAGPEKSGDNSVLDPSMLANTGVSFLEPATIINSESMHPYTNNPEDLMWNEACLAAKINQYPQNSAYYGPCNLVNTSSSNSLKIEWLNLIEKSQNPTWGISHSITETGFPLSVSDTLHQARWIMRLFLGFQALGVSPIDFYRLYDTSPDALGFTNVTTQAPLPAYTAIAGLMSDLAVIGNAPVAPYPNSSLSSVVSYSGKFPLNTVHMVGTRAGDTANSEIIAVWQQSTTTGSWATMAQPAAVPVTIAIPAGTVVSTVRNLDTRANVPYTITGQNITFAVSDDPIGVLVIP